MPLAPGVFLFEISVGGVHGHVFPARLRSGTKPEQKRFIEEGRNSHQVSPKTVDASIVPRCMAFYNCFPSRGLPMSVQVLWSATGLCFSCLRSTRSGVSGWLKWQYGGTVCLDRNRPILRVNSAVRNSRYE